ncbi:MAG: glycosyltransferase family 4 protein, partial [Thermoproteota archaeon]
MQEKIRVVVYGGGNGKEITLGGHLWLSKVAEQLTHYRNLEVIRIPGPKVGKNRVKNLVNAYVQGFKVLKMKPDVVILDAGKDGNAALSLLHIFLSKRSKIYLPLHHYEPMRIGKHNRIGNFFAKLLLYVTYKLNEKLWEEAPALFVVSKHAKKEIAEKLRIPENKLVLTGNSIELHKECCCEETQKDIDFLCIGRIGKFSHLINIWKEIRKIKPEVNFHMAGIGQSNSVVRKLEEIGNFKHHGVVSEEEKVILYNRSKVFIFPSLYEGFGIAVAEALSCGLPVVAWNLPVYEEIWGDSIALRKVKIGDYSSFAKEAVFALENFDKLSEDAKRTSRKLNKNWEEIGRI